MFKSIIIAVLVIVSCVLFLQNKAQSDHIENLRNCVQTPNCHILNP